MDSPLPLVLALPRVDRGQDESDFILLHVSSAGGGHPLDLNLIGTENSAVFSVSFNHSQRTSSKAKTFPGNQDEWEQTLSAILLGIVEIEFTKGIEAVAKVEKDGSSINVAIQKRIEGITQRLGAITLPANEEAEVDLYEWCRLTIKAKQDSSQTLERLKNKLRQSEEETKKLNDTLVELTKLKNDHENSLIEKFSLLLNEKKLKIRDQQRLLATATVDPGKLEAVGSHRIPTRSSPPGPSRTGKRKAGNRINDASDVSDDGFEKMDVDGKGSEQEDRQTADEQTTDGETSEDEEAPVQLTARKAVNSAMASDIGNASEAVAPAEEIKAPPPKRDLPFVNRAAVSVLKPTAAPVDGSETESDDDEL